jgi:hypothetical protein
MIHLFFGGYIFPGIFSFILICYFKIIFRLSTYDLTLKVCINVLISKGYNGVLCII